MGSLKMHPRKTETFLPHTLKSTASALALFMLLFSPFSQAKIHLEKKELEGLSQTSLLSIKGHNFSDSNVILVIRADDSANPSYSERANIERVLPFGKYELQIPLASLRTPSGRQLKLKNIQKMMIFAPKSPRQFMLHQAEIYTPKPLSKDAFAWDLGPEGSAIWPGFTPLTLASGLFKGARLQALDRSARMHAADPLTMDGIRGIDSLQLVLPKGEWDLTLWTRDAGEWEYLPHPLQQKISANGKTLYSSNKTPKQWIKDVYLRGQTLKASPKSSSWTLFGEQKNHRIGFSVITDGSPLKLKLEGDTQDAQFISAIVATPKNNPHILEMLTRQRKAWWEKNWPIAQWKEWPTGQIRLETPKEHHNGAPGTSLFIEFEFEQGHIQGAPFVVIEPAKWNDIQLPTTWHWSQWQFTRTHLSSTLLEPNNQYLRFGLMTENKGVAMPKKIVIRIDLPENARSGLYKGKINLLLNGKTLKAPFSVSVLNARLPPINKPIGIYLEKPVHFGWFKGLESLGDQALLCDLAFLRKIGLSGISPPFPTPSNEKEQTNFHALSASLNQLGFLSPLAYAPAKRLQQAVGAHDGAKIIAEIETAHAKRLQKSPYWSIADEPSNPGHKDTFKKMHRNLKVSAPRAKLAGHLNHPEDKRFLSMFDLVLINDGFGVDKRDIQNAKKGGRKVWLYNLPNPRGSAGFYLWNTGADGFLKWHGRMPTADPFNPTDGREYDVQLLYPSLHPCPKEPDIHENLYKIVDGIVDYRWLLWLKKEAASKEEAHALFVQLQDEIPTQWDEMLKISEKQLQAWRERIIELAL